MIEMSLSPPLMKLSASFRFDSGTTAPGFASYHSTSRSSKALNRKK